MRLRLLAVPMLTVAFLAACTTPAPGPGEVPFNDCSLPEDYVDAACTGDGQWLADNLDLDSYLLEGVVDGVSFSGVICALNLDPSWIAYRDGNEGFGLEQAVLFMATDGDLTRGTVDGVWDTTGGAGNFIELTEGSWSRQGAGGMKEDGSIEVRATVRDHYTDPEAGTDTRDGSTVFTLTAIPTSQSCVDHTNLDALRQEREELGIEAWD